MGTPRVGAAAPQHEHEFEAAHGLPEPLPSGETLLWQGAPDWKLLARQAMHVPALIGYFTALLVLRAALLLSQGDAAVEVARSTLLLLPLPVIAVGLALLLAWLSARTTAYTLTDRRVVMRIGIVLTVTFNFPLACIERAAQRKLPGRAGDIALALEPGTRIAWLQLWPHVRPWRVARSEPMLRALPDAAAVATLLVQAWQAARADAAHAADAGVGMPRPAVPTQRPATGPATDRPYAVAT